MRAVAGLAVVLLLAGCSDATWRTKDIEGLMPALDFQLVAEDGRTVTEEDFAGSVNLLFFGFTHCPDVCPITLGQLGAALDRLPPAAREDVRVLFVSVDPGRDDPASLREYTDHFGPAFVGLTGDRDALDRLTRRYRVTYGYGAETAPGEYPVSHSSAVFAFDPSGEPRLLMRDDDGVAAIAADLERLAGES